MNVQYIVVDLVSDENEQVGQATVCFQTIQMYLDWINEVLNPLDLRRTKSPFFKSAERFSIAIIFFEKVEWTLAYFSKFLRNTHLKAF